jgi:anthraniloyl-CoA monooxygenase
LLTVCSEYHPTPSSTNSFGQFHSGAIRRSELLRILLEGADEAGAQVSIDVVVSVVVVRDAADIVVGAVAPSSTETQRRQRRPP